MQGSAQFADAPISSPDEDLFGLQSFSAALARSILEMRSPRGVVIGINGPWGAGKSSAINLIRHQLLQTQEAAGDVVPVSFDPWWFSGEDALALEFFRVLNASIKSSLGAKAKKALPKIGARILKASAMVASPMASAAGVGPAGDIAKSLLDGLAGLIESDETVAGIYAELVEALQKQKKRFIVFVDDIDRLNPDEALAMFRLIKSVGRLPNVIYILAFDRALAERVVSDKFPSEGPHYLEKNVQASFDLPRPNSGALTNILLGAINSTTGMPTTPPEQLRFMNIFHSTVRPLVSTPRDAVRFATDIAITWPAIAGEVDVASFIAIEAYRLFRPGIYHALRDQQTLVCGGADDSRSQRISAADLDSLLLASVAEPAHYRDGLARVFPKLASIWSNYFQSAHLSWAAGRYVCDAKYFPIYFTYTLPAGVLPRKEIDEFIAHAGDANWVRERLVTAAEHRIGPETTEAAAFLEDLKNRGSEIPLAAAPAFLGGVFKAADQLLEVDNERGFLEVGTNPLRIHWLLRSVLMERTDLHQRSRILRQAAKDASLVWLADFARSVGNDYDFSTEKAKDPDHTLMTFDDAKALVKLALRAIKQAARDGTLIDAPELHAVLFRWTDFADDDGVSVRKWTSARLRDDAAVAKLASAFTSSSISHSVSDLVSTRSDYAATEGLERIIDVDRFRARLDLLRRRLDKGSDEFQTIDRFLTAWDNRRRG